MESNWDRAWANRHKVHPMLNGSPAPYSKPRGYGQTIRQEAREYKAAMRRWRAEQPASPQKQVPVAPAQDSCGCCSDLFLCSLLAQALLAIPKCIWYGVRGVGRHLKHKMVNGF
jgi:hypothetical protein